MVSGSKNYISKVLVTEDDSTLDHQGIGQAQSITDMSLDVHDILTNLQSQMEGEDRDLTPRQDFKGTLPSERTDTSVKSKMPATKALDIKLNTKLVTATQDSSKEPLKSARIESGRQVRISDELDMLRNEVLRVAKV